jgi:hypothetical protein
MLGQPEPDPGICDRKKKVERVMRFWVLAGVYTYRGQQNLKSFLL